VTRTDFFWRSKAHETLLEKPMEIRVRLLQLEELSRHDGELVPFHYRIALPVELPCELQRRFLVRQCDATKRDNVSLSHFIVL
jgi:hypothetical protein